MAPHYLFCLLLIITSIFLMILPLFKHGNLASKKLPPGPKKLPIIGNLHQLGALPHVAFHKLSIKHGPLMFLQLGSIPTLVISSGEVAREVFLAHDLTFSGRPALYAAKKLTYGLLDIAFAPYGEFWRDARRISVIELLSMKRVQSFRAVREKEVEILISSIRSLSMAPVNLSEMLHSLAISIVMRVVFGDKYEGRNFPRILDEMDSLLGGFCLSDFFPRLQWIHRFTGLHARLEKNFGELDEFYNRVIEDGLWGGWPEPEDEDLVHVLLRLHKDPVHGVTFSSMNSIKALLTDMFFAGTDTTSATLVWAMAELMRTPRVLNKLQKELREVVGNKRKVDEDDLQHLNYLKLVIKEVLRLHPPAPLLVPRETIETCNILEYEIPAKTRVFINAKAISRDPKAWTNPEEFWPERFSSNATDFRGQDFIFIPFGVGRRSCPGINFAIVMIELALANLLYNFNWGLPLGLNPNDLDLEEAFGIVVHKKTPLCLIVKP